MNDLLAKAQDAARSREAELLPKLRRWVTTNSFSGNTDGVNSMGELLLEDFDLPALSVDRRAGVDVGDHLFWSTPGWDQQADRRILLVGHHDTVFPPGTFEVWEHQGDRLRGPGVLDMKGGVAIIHHALASLADAGALAEIPVGFVSVGDEEIGSADSRPWVESIAEGASCALVFEAGRAEDAIITQRKGTGRFRVRVTGKAAHAGNDHADGINSIWALAQFIDRVQRFTDYDRGVTVNVGTIEGGSSANTVPAQAECQVDFRFITLDDGQHLVGRFDHAARELGQATGAKFELNGGVRRAPLERTDASLEVYRHYGACAKQSGLGDVECGLLGGGSDASTVSAVGVPAIDGLGPRGFGFHTHDEYIEVSSLMLRVDALLRFLLSWKRS